MDVHPRTDEGRNAGGVAHIGVLPLVGPEDVAVAGTDRLTEAAVLQGVTDKGVEVVVLTEVEHIVHGVFPRPVPTGPGALADSIGIAVGQVGKFIFEAILTVSARAHGVVELALPDETLDGLHPEVGGHGQAVVMVLVVAAGGIDHLGDRVGNGGNQVPDTAVAEVIILRERAVLQVSGDQRVRGQHVEDIVPIMVAGADTALLGLHEGEVLTDGDDVQAVFLQSTWSEFRRTVMRE